MTSSVDLSIIIVNWNCKDVIFKCIDSILYTIKKYKYEIMVVDNNSTDGSLEEIILKYPQVVVIKNKTNELFAKANNQGYAVSKGKYILVLNSDVVLTENAIDGLIPYLEKEEKIVTCTLLNEDGTIQYGMHRTFPTFFKVLFSFTYLKLGFSFFKSYADKYLYLDNDFSKNFYLDQAAGAFLLVKREVIENLGYLFDEKNFPLLFNDLDFCYRAKRLGISILCVSEIKVFHSRSFSLKKLTRPRYIYLWVKSFLLFKWKFLWN